MKITINTKVAKEVEIPMYFEQNGRHCKLIDDKYYLSVMNQDFDPVLDLVPNISVRRIDCLGNEFSHISENDFNLAYLGAEHKLNSLRS